MKKQFQLIIFVAVLKSRAGMYQKTKVEAEQVAERCRDIFVKKTKDYGTAWRILRPSSLTDQIFIKAKRLRSIEEKGKQEVSDNIYGEYIALVNYGIMAMIQMDLPEDEHLEMTLDEVEPLYNKYLQATLDLMLAKNHDYGEAWREMRISSLTDLILMKLLRIKQIEDNDGQTLISEGLAGNYQDIINYAIFAMIRLGDPDKG